MEAIPYLIFSTDGYFTHPVNILLILLGVSIRSAQRSRWAQWIWVGLLVLAAAACEIMWAQRNDIGNGLAVSALCIPVIDFFIGTAIVDISRAIKGLYRWISTDEITND